MKIGYARESTSKKTQDQPLEWHIDRLKRHGCDRIFIDRASGASKKRSGYNEMMGLVEAGVATEIVVTSLKRFGRSVPEIYRAIELILEKGIKFTMLDGSVDFTTAVGRANFGIQAVAAQMERELIAERISSGYEWMRSQKIPIHAPFGYQIVNKELRINRDVEAIARWIRQSIIEVGLIKTTQAVNTLYPDLAKVPRTPGGLKHWIDCPTLYGHLQYGRHTDEPVVHRNNHEALFSEQERLEVEASLKFRERHHGFKSDPVRFPFSGLVYCAHCGSSMQVSYTHKRNQQVVYYRCYKWLRKTCTNRGYTSVKKIEKAVFEELIKRAEQIANAAISSQANIDENPQLAELRSQKAALEKMLPNSHIQAAIDAITTDIAVLETENHIPFSLEPEKEKVLNASIAPNFWQELQPEKKSAIYRLLIKRIVCNSSKQVESVELWV